VATRTARRASKNGAHRIRLGGRVTNERPPPSRGVPPSAESAGRPRVPQGRSRPPHEIRGGARRPGRAGRRHAGLGRHERGASGGAGVRAALVWPFGVRANARDRPAFATDAASAARTPGPPSGVHAHSPCARRARRPGGLQPAMPTRSVRWSAGAPVRSPVRPPSYKGSCRRDRGASRSRRASPDRWRRARRTGARRSAGDWASAPPT
jgi:hypothetical protein